MRSLLFLQFNAMSRLINACHNDCISLLINVIKTSITLTLRELQVFDPSRSERVEIFGVQAWVQAGVEAGGTG